MRGTGVAQRDAWRHKTLPPAGQVRPDLWSVPVPIPGRALRYTLTYLLAAAASFWSSTRAWAPSRPGS